MVCLINWYRLDETQMENIRFNHSDEILEKVHFQLHVPKLQMHYSANNAIWAGLAKKNIGDFPLDGYLSAYRSPAFSHHYSAAESLNFKAVSLQASDRKSSSDWRRFSWLLIYSKL